MVGDAVVGRLGGPGSRLGHVVLTVPLVSMPVVPTPVVATPTRAPVLVTGRLRVLVASAAPAA